MPKIATYRFQLVAVIDRTGEPVGPNGELLHDLKQLERPEVSGGKLFFRGSVLHPRFGGCRRGCINLGSVRVVWWWKRGQSS